MKKENFMILWTLPLALSIGVICFAILFTLNFRQLYYWDIEYLSIPQNTHMDKDEIKENYNILINYITDEENSQLVLPSFGMSEEGRIHFEDVKHIFTLLKKVVYILGIYSLLGILISVVKKNYSFVKYAAILLLAIPLTIAALVMSNFDKSFVVFHKLAFRNDYWIFDPATDPVITILPQEFFMHSFLLIIIIIVLMALLFGIIYLITTKTNRRR